MTASGTQSIRVLVREEQGAYSAQCLEVDIAVQAPDVPTLAARVCDVLSAYCKRDLARGRKPFEGMRPAPKWFHDQWPRALHIPDAESIAKHAHPSGTHPECSITRQEFALAQ